MTTCSLDPILGLFASSQAAPWSSLVSTARAKGWNRLSRNELCWLGRAVKFCALRRTFFVFGSSHNDYPEQLEIWKSQCQCFRLHFTFQASYSTPQRQHLQRNQFEKCWDLTGIVIQLSTVYSLQFSQKSFNSLVVYGGVSPLSNIAKIFMVSYG